MRGFWKAFKSDFLVSGTPPAPRPSAGAVEPSEETAEPSADTARPRSRTAEPRPAHGDSTFSSEPGASPPGTFYGDSAALSKPGAKDAQPSTETTKPSADIVKPNRDSRARGGSQERSWCCTGLRGFGAKTSRGNFETRGGQSQNCEAQAIWPISVKKMVFKSDVLVWASRKWEKNCERQIQNCEAQHDFSRFWHLRRSPVRQFQNREAQTTLTSMRPSQNHVFGHAKNVQS